MALSTSTSSSGFSGQINTQNPQTAGRPASTAAKSGSVQPGTATALLNSQQGVALHSTALPTVNLDASPTQTRTVSGSQPAPPQPRYHINPVLLGFPAVLVLVAAVMIWLTARSVKSTTE